MAITLRNKALEAKIKEIGRRTGLGPSAVIARAIEREGAQLGIDDSDRERQERLARMRAFLKDLPPQQMKSGAPSNRQWKTCTTKMACPVDRHRDLGCRRDYSK